MKAMILVGGMGTRLRPLTFSIPKPLLPVGEKPILEVLLGQLRRAGVDEIVLATGYHAELIRAFCGDGGRFGVSVTYVHEEKPLGTAGPLGALRGHVSPGEQVLLLNGDIITELDFGHFIETARAGACDLTVAYTRYVYRSPYGVLSIKDGAITGVTEKPEQEYAISAGIYSVGAAALELIPPDTFFTMPELMHRLMEKGRRIQAYAIPGYWLGLESLEHFSQALEKLGEVPGLTSQE